MKTTMICVRVSTPMNGTEGLAFFGACPTTENEVRWVPMQGIRDAREIHRGRWIHRDLLARAKDEAPSTAFDPIDRLDMMAVEELPGFSSGITDDAVEHLAVNIADLQNGSWMNTGPLDLDGGDAALALVGVFSIDAVDFRERSHTLYSHVVSDGVERLTRECRSDLDGLFPFVPVVPQ